MKKLRSEQMEDWKADWLWLTDGLMNEQMEQPVNTQTEGVKQEGWKMIPGGVHGVLMHESM